MGILFMIIKRGDFMAPGDTVQYKKYAGCVKFVCTGYCIVTLFNYHGLPAVDRRCEFHELQLYVQMKIEGC